MFLMPDHKWTRLLAYVSGLVNQKLLLQNGYLAAENRILRARLPARMRLSDPERSTLAEIGKRLGRAALQEVACVAKPDSILAWYRRLICPRIRRLQVTYLPGRRLIAPELEALIVRCARENSGWGYDRIVGSSFIWNLVVAWPRRLDQTSHFRLDGSDRRNATDENSGFLHGQRYLLHDRDS
jgi:hypothetical protein